MWLVLCRSSRRLRQIRWTYKTSAQFQAQSQALSKEVQCVEVTLGIRNGVFDRNCGVCEGNWERPSRCIVNRNNHRLSQQRCCACGAAPTRSNRILPTAVHSSELVNNRIFLQFKPHSCNHSGLVEDVVVNLQRWTSQTFH